MPSSDLLTSGQSALALTFRSTDFCTRSVEKQEEKDVIWLYIPSVNALTAIQPLLIIVRFLIPLFCTSFPRHAAPMLFWK